ncbi:hypothetical protein M427DRAFT_194420 [Gonapodya prolifera JEL478]|uniref:Late embryogenesis abundant protein LEA-2 subgroup domain-containing protein n=1 Tax=Gonapodya prolifera (strain JEL478) TaxID=1344416 RepID=A0A139API2_GONPJ|nr:hypothetical protein M427DRAFT_194420 [Gonapodya prolifera JEL478]|eukprot:KXS18554.1 hypothetical protein M427DRAFT_194420 [Gonapodya prolifera JEL478]
MSASATSATPRHTRLSHSRSAGFMSQPLRTQVSVDSVAPYAHSPTVATANAQATSVTRSRSLHAATAHAHALPVLADLLPAAAAPTPAARTLSPPRRVPPSPLRTLPSLPAYRPPSPTPTAISLSDFPRIAPPSRPRSPTLHHHESDETLADDISPTSPNSPSKPLLRSTPSLPRPTASTYTPSLPRQHHRSLSRHHKRRACLPPRPFCCCPSSRRCLFDPLLLISVLVLLVAALAVAAYLCFPRIPSATFQSTAVSSFAIRSSNENSPAARTAADVVSQWVAGVAGAGGGGSSTSGSGTGTNTTQPSIISQLARLVTLGGPYTISANISIGMLVNSSNLVDWGVDWVDVTLSYPLPTTPLAHGRSPFFVLSRLSSTPFSIPLSLSRSTPSLLTDPAVVAAAGACGVALPGSSASQAGVGKEQRDEIAAAQPAPDTRQLRLWYVAKVEPTLLAMVRWTGVSWAPEVSGEVVVECPVGAL